MLPEQTVGVLFSAVLTRIPGIAEADLEARGVGELPSAGHLDALAPGQRPPESLREARHHLCEAANHGLGDMLAECGSQ